MINIIATKKSWIEGIAVDQLKHVSTLKGVKSAVGLPDLHAGPVGISVASDSMIYPHLVGNDIGCGMSLWQIDTASRKVKLDRWVKKLEDLQSSFEGDVEYLVEKYDLHERSCLEALGTIGLGNHFAELQKVEKVINQDLFDEYNLSKEKLFLLTHSGSRGLGSFIMDSHIQKNGSISLKADSPEGKEYLVQHNYAVKWAKANRELISRRFMDSLYLSGNPVLDLTHNSVTLEKYENESLWVHRKGANPNNQGIAVVAGSRGTLSYLVKPIGDLSITNFSIAHGAGRKLKRSVMEARIKSKKRLSDLFQTKLGGRVICEDRKLLYEEAPEAYKNIEQVISDLQEFGLVEVIASFRPLLTFKTRDKR